MLKGAVDKNSGHGGPDQCEANRSFCYVNRSEKLINNGIVVSHKMQAVYEGYDDAGTESRSVLDGRRR